MGDPGLGVVQVDVEHADRRAADDRDEGVDAAQVVPLRVGDQPRRGVGPGRPALGAGEVVGCALEAGLDLGDELRRRRDGADARTFDGGKLRPVAVGSGSVCARHGL